MYRSLDFILHKPRHPFCGRLFDYYWTRACASIGIVKKPNDINIDDLMAGDPAWHSRLDQMKHHVYVWNVPHQFCGVGHLTSEWNAGFMLSQRYKLNFVHVPLPDPWEDFLGWGKGELTYNSVKRFKKIRLPLILFKSNVDCVEKLAYLISRHEIKEKTLFVLGYNQNAYDQTESGEILRKKYDDHLAWKSVEVHKKDGGVTIAVHLRKGDILKSEKDMKKRYIDATWMADLVSDIVGNVKRTAKINLYSQGLTEEDKLAFSKVSGVSYFDNVDPCETFHNLLISDILVMSRSGFSYLAACMGRQLVIAPPKFWHCIPKGDRWIQMGEAPVLESKSAELISEYFSTHMHVDPFDGLNSL